MRERGTGTWLELEFDWAKKNVRMLAGASWCGVSAHPNSSEKNVWWPC